VLATAGDGKQATLTCEFVQGDDDITLYWLVNGIMYTCTTLEEDIASDSNGGSTENDTSVLSIRGTKSFKVGEEYSVECGIQQSIPPVYKNDESFEEGFIRATRGGSVRIVPEGCA
jgi:hypothetical protein